MKAQGPRVSDGSPATNTSTTGASIKDQAAFERVCEALRSAGKVVRLTGCDHASAQCPAHDDRQASLAIWRKPGRAKIKCFVGCDDALDILPALGLSARDLYDNPGRG